ncbi:polyribonucleotide nucleotidyltransferase [bacterium BMS3Bbin07]|nr:polyribonucleotide nucleotidyltransferase [bacterium BMS3Bbin07]HDH01592.1 polyribonucleotide nucleotidyltransferase [Nitrospirota bacterium]
MSEIDAPHREKHEIRGHQLIIETGELAKQSDGSALISYGDTVVLATAVASKRERKDLDFFPLTIDYQEKAYAAGKIPGGFFKREGKPSEKEVLASRLIDRPIRPLFPDGFRSETQGIASVISFGDENVSDILGIIGVSTALMLSDIPFDGPVSAVRVGRIDGELVLCPSLEELENMELNFVVAGTDDAVMMVEGSAIEVSEEIVLEAIDVAHEEIKKINVIQRRLAEVCGKPKRQINPTVIDEALKEEVRSYVIDRMKEAVRIPSKMKRQEALDILLEETLETFASEEEDRAKEISGIFHDIEKDLVRRMIIDEGVRTDGRKPEDIRHIYGKVGFLPKVHGSALFVRGETQALVAVTLGTSADEQRIDALEGETFKSFMLHYNFPPFSVGEVKRLGFTGRREIGHGALAEKALKPIIPSKEKFPYTIRIVSDILESNGSSSMATVCGATLALMDAGVPIETPVAGIAMGLIHESDKTVVLSDILGLEDHLGDMDFKVTGTKKGVTAFQMDVKISGITREIMESALEQAKAGRFHILEKMNETLPEPRKNLAPNAPRIYTIQIKPEKIRDVIGVGGKVIRGITEQTGVKIDIDDTGLINIASADEASAMKAKEIIEGIVQDVEVGRIYMGKVKKVVDFGAFVEVLPGVEGLLHISQISDERVGKVTDVINYGDEFPVKVIEIDDMGRLKLSRKEALREEAKGKTKG